MIYTVDLLSKSPVGSSKRIIEGELARDLAMATLCCSPPESSLGKCSALYINPTLFSSILVLYFMYF